MSAVVRSVSGSGRARSCLPVVSDQSRTVWSASIVPSRRPSGLNSTSAVAGGTRINRSWAPVTPSQRRNVPSAPTVARSRPAGSNATAVTAPRWPVTVSSSVPSCRSHTVAPPSARVVAKRDPSALTATRPPHRHGHHEARAPERPVERLPDLAREGRVDAVGHRDALEGEQDAPLGIDVEVRYCCCGELPTGGDACVELAATLVTDGDRGENARDDGQGGEQRHHPLQAALRAPLDSGLPCARAASAAVAAERWARLASRNARSSR